MIAAKQHTVGAADLRQSDTVTHCDPKPVNFQRWWAAMHLRHLTSSDDAHLNPSQKPRGGTEYRWFLTCNQKEWQHVTNPIHLQCLQPPDLLQLPSSSTSDPITAVAAQGSTLVVARSSGVVYRYSLPGLVLEGQHLLRCRPQYIRLNCDATRMSVIDFNGVLTFFDATVPGTGKMTGEHLTMERKVGGLLGASGNDQ